MNPNKSLDERLVNEANSTLIGHIVEEATEIPLGDKNCSAMNNNNENQNTRQQSPSSSSMSSSSQQTSSSPSQTGLDKPLLSAADLQAKAILLALNHQPKGTWNGNTGGFTARGLSSEGKSKHFKDAISSQFRIKSPLDLINGLSHKNRISNCSLIDSSQMSSCDGLVRAHRGSHSEHDAATRSAAKLTSAAPQPKGISRNLDLASNGNSNQLQQHQQQHQQNFHNLTGNGLSQGSNSMALSATSLIIPFPVSSRRVRDSGSLVFMLTFMAFLVYMIWDGYVTKEADVQLIIHGHDSYGNICGQNNRPMRFVDKSGQNYTSKPFTKYTLINANFERYTLISGKQLGSHRAAYETFTMSGKSLGSLANNIDDNPHDVWYMKDSLGTGNHANLIRQRTNGLSETKRKPDGRRLSKRDDSLDDEAIANLRRAKSSLMYQYPPMYIQTPNDPGDHKSAQMNKTSPLDSTGNQPQTPNMNRVEHDVTGPINSIDSSLESRQITNKNNIDDDLSYDHVMVNTSQLIPKKGINNNNSHDPRIPDILNHNEATNQLLYLTECVDTCPTDHMELILFRCIPKNWRFSLFPNAINITRTFIDDIMTDISHCYREFIYIFSFSLLLSLVFLILLRFLASFIIWACIGTLTSILISTACYAWLNYYHLILDLNDLTSHEASYSDRMSQTDKWLIGSIFLTFMALAALVTIIFMRRRILLVTTLFRESGKAIADMPLLLLQPILTFATLLAIMVAWSVAMVYLQSIKIPFIDRTTGFVVYRAETIYKFMKWYHIFAFLWISHFAIACQHYVIGASVTKWYFSPDRFRLGSPIGTSVSELILYYLGSVALGSFLVAIFKALRILLRQIQYLIQRNCMSTSPSGVGRFNSMTGPMNLTPDAMSSPGTSWCGSLGYVFRLCIWFFDKIVMIISRDAYVEMAIHGHSFITGAQRAFTVLASNPLKLLAIKTISSILLTISKICVVFGTISMAILMIEEKSASLNYSWSPILVSAIYAYIVAHWFLSVYEMVIDALFICYCEDYERTKFHDQILALENNSRALVGSQFMSQILHNTNNLHHY